MENKRAYGLDIFRVLCCVGVLAYHIMDDVLNEPNVLLAKTIYYAASYCIPGFFVLAGYLYAQKKDITVDYIEGKIKQIMLKLFGWSIFWSVVFYVKNVQLTDPWGTVLASAQQAGILVVAWFLFTYCACLILAYPMGVIYQKYRGIASCVTCIWIICLACGIGSGFETTRGQVFWLHKYFGYFCMGMLCASVLFWIEKKVEKYRRRYFFANVFLCVGASIVYAINICMPAEMIPPHLFYGKWYYSVWLYGLFNVVTMIRCKENVGRIVQRLSENTFVVYLVHLPLLLMITEKTPLHSSIEAVICLIFIFTITQIMAEIFRRMPLFRRLV